jgi:hypothetical protein
MMKAVPDFLSVTPPLLVQPGSSYGGAGSRGADGDCYTAIGTEGDMIQGNPAILQADISAKEKGDRLGF